jgi:hypothetical protein
MAGIIATFAKASRARRLLTSIPSSKSVYNLDRYAINDFFILRMMISFGLAFNKAVDNKYLRDKKRWDQLTRTLGTGEDDMLQEAWAEYRVKLTDSFSFKLRDFLEEGVGLGKGELLQMEDLYF